MNSPQVPMRIRHFAIQFQYSMFALLLMSVCPFRALAQVSHSHTAAAQQTEQTPDQTGQQNALLKIVRESTARFKDVSVAEAEGYALQFGCVSGDDYGAMGLHYINGDLVGSGVIDATHPQIVIYEPQPGGGLKLIGADFLVLKSTWDAAHKDGPPQLMGQAFHLFTAPNRFELPAFYTLHVWAWKENPLGAFVNWHPNVSCQAFSNQAH
ncbi:MAG TPA: hypothetical protein VFE61_09010 [Candidatus Sulfotelmatobacter sp.]|jgi:hypothetical protein|nr:hypothetical protein [Candidatus Sulfotelmatobacter sp.]